MGPITDVMVAFAHTSMWAQLVEHALAAVVPSAAVVGDSEADVSPHVEKGWASTFGQLVAGIRANANAGVITVTDADLALLVDARDRRNQLAHEFWVRNIFDLLGRDGAERAIAWLEDTRDKLTDCLQVVWRAVEPAAAARGVELGRLLRTITIITPALVRSGALEGLDPFADPDDLLERFAAFLTSLARDDEHPPSSPAGRGSEPGR